MNRKQKDLLRAIAPGLKDGSISSTLLFGRGDDLIWVDDPNGNGDKEWTHTWTGIVSEADLLFFVREGIFFQISQSMYGLDTDAIISLVDTDFGSRPKDSIVKYIFISYARENQDKTLALSAFLEYAYDNVWFDKYLQGGDIWWHEILKNIERCTDFIFLLSSHSIASEYCRKEHDEAAQLGKRILPICVDPELKEYPTWINHRHVIRAEEFTPDSISRIFAFLIRTNIQPS